MNFKPLLILFCTTLIGLHKIDAQNNNFKQWSVADGLPQSNIYAIKQDQRGYLWLGTGAGLSRFDGRHFINFSKKEGLVGTVVRSIMEDSHGRLWFGTNEGISIYDGYKFSNINKANGLAGTTILCLLEDRKGGFWAGSDDGGLNQILFQKDSIIIKVFNEENQLSSNAIFDIVEDNNHNLWTATFGGLNILQPIKEGYLVKQIRGADRIPSDMLLSIAKTKNGNILVGSYDAGIFEIIGANLKFDGKEIPIHYAELGESPSVWDILISCKDEQWLASGQNGIIRTSQNPYKLEHYTTNQGLSSNQILAIFEDSEHNIWIGTNGDGLCMLQGDEFAHYGLKDGLSNVKIMDAKSDDLGNLWVATDGGGLNRIQFQDGKPSVKIFNQNDGLNSNFITSIALPRLGNNNLWIGTTNQGILKYNGTSFTQFDEATGLNSDRINTLYTDSKGKLWIGTSEGISLFDGKDFINFSTQEMKMNNLGVNSILEDAKGQMWFGTSGGLARYKGGNKMRTFDEMEGLSSIEINTLATDKKGNIWIGTKSGGLFKFNASQSDTNAISLFADMKILGSNSIQSLTFENDNSLIVGTLKGIDVLKIDAKGNFLSVRNFDKTDGFRGVECNTNAICKDKEGNIWLGTVNGLTRFNPKSLPRTENKANIQFTNIQLFYEDINWKQKSDSVLPWFSLPLNLNLTFSENNITFKFSAISLKNPEKIKYRYLLEGQDANWSPIQELNEAHFSGLSDGSYTLKVMALDANGAWTKPIAYPFNIYPPWWKTKWAIGGGILCLGLLIIVVVKYRESQLQAEKRILEQTVAERTAEVVLQKEEITHQKNEIIGSITYAQRIQFAILPALDTIKEKLPESFVLYKPKDIVAGDFYWMESLSLPSKRVDGEFEVGTSSSLPLGEVRDASVLVLFAACDCTGHGVPGAMVSVVCSNALNRAVNEFHLTETGKILDKVRELVIQTFEKSHQDVKDGMDISLIGIQQNKNETIIQWSGANNPLLYFEDGILNELKANKQPIGKTDNPSPFTTHVHTFSSSRTYYLITDGYADQFGESGKKMMKKKLKEMLESVQGKPMQEQESILSDFFDKWKGSTEQTDDVTIIGVKL